MIERNLNFLSKKPLLYLVATPIGNLSEFTPRAIEVISECDYVACEDSRNTGSLLHKFNLDKPLISCHEHNEEEASAKIIAFLLEGKKVAYVSDAGYPIVSDPGARLAKNAIAKGINISVVNGPNAGICALVGSGLPSEHFYFYGFLDSKPSSRKKELEAVKGTKDTIIFYESPHRIDKTLNDMSMILGPRNACLCRELTKAHEEYIRGTLDELATLDPDTLIGEMVIVVEGASEIKEELSDEEISSLLKDRLKKDSPSFAVKAIAKETGISKNRVYDIYLKTLS